MGRLSGSFVICDIDSTSFFGPTWATNRDTSRDWPLEPWSHNITQRVRLLAFGSSPKNYLNNFLAKTANVNAWHTQ